jgi:diguanylate cyclase (GGDEF)-like protein
MIRQKQSFLIVTVLFILSCIAHLSAFNLTQAIIELSFFVFCFVLLISIVTENKIQKKNAQSNYEQFESFNEKISILLQTHESRLLHTVILTEAISLLHADKGVLGLCDIKDGKIKITSKFNYPEPDHENLYFNQILNLVYKNQEPFVINGTNITTPLQHSDTTIAAVPLITDNFISGAILVARNAVNRPFSEIEMLLLNMFSHHAALALRNTIRLEEAQYRARTDSLTGLFNFRHFLDLAKKEIERTLRYNHTLSLIIFDIDHFKAVNDTFGHQAGDQVLETIAVLGRQLFRRIDIIGRYGGEEFVVLLPETPVDITKEVADRFRKAVELQTVNSKKAQISITISIGIASLCNNCTTLESLMERADIALYKAKNGGRNRISIWDSSMRNILNQKRKSKHNKDTKPIDFPEIIVQSKGSL